MEKRKRIYHYSRIPKVVARIYDDEKSKLLENWGGDTICPSELSEKELSYYNGGQQGL